MTNTEPAMLTARDLTPCKIRLFQDSPAYELSLADASGAIVLRVSNDGRGGCNRYSDQRLADALTDAQLVADFGAFEPLDGLCASFADGATSYADAVRLSAEADAEYAAMFPNDDDDDDDDNDPEPAAMTTAAPFAFPTSCDACNGTHLTPDDSGDACDACTYFVEGEPCQTRDQVVAEVRAYLAVDAREDVEYAIRDFALTAEELTVEARPSNAADVADAAPPAGESGWLVEEPEVGPYDPTSDLADVVEAIEAEVAHGVVPDSVRSFAELHDHLDANELLLAASDFAAIFHDAEDGESWIPAANLLSSLADRWLADDGLADLRARLADRKA